MNQVQTGPVGPQQLGVTLTHEHLSMDFSFMAIPPSPKEKHMAQCPFTLANAGWIHRNPFSHRSNLILNDDISREAIWEEMALFKQVGGATIVENTTTGLTRDIRFLKEVALKTGINIIAGAGFYVAKSQAPNVLQYSTEKIADILRQELTVGADGTDIKCGIIGEMASVWPIQPFERRALQAAAIVQQELEVPVMAHPHRVPNESPKEIVRIYQEAGGRASKLVMAHLDRTYFTSEDIIEFSKQGTYLELDMFGIECSHYQLEDGADFLSDAQRIRILKDMIKEGLEDRIVLAHDVWGKHRLMKFGGQGYSHILRNLVPKMLQRGISQEQIDKFLIINPRNWLGG